MRITAIVLAFLCFSVQAAESKGVYQNFDADDTSPGKCDVILTDGVGDFYLSGDFGSGTATLQQQMEGGSWVTIDTFTADPDPKTQTIMGGDGMRVRVILSGSTNPDLDCNIND